eukprot:4496460-Pyramimonas_sp.AAC.1
MQQSLSLYRSLCANLLSVAEGGTWNAVVCWFELELDDAATLASRAEPERQLDGVVQVAASWHQAVFFLDELPIRAGDAVVLRVRRDAYQ